MLYVLYVTFILVCYAASLSLQIPIRFVLMRQARMIQLLIFK